MKASVISAILTLAAFATLSVPSSFGDDKDVKKPAAAPDAKISVKPAEPGKSSAADAMMAGYMMAITPGPQHKLLERFVGKFAVTTKVWMDPSQPPIETTGKAEGRLLFDGRFVALDIEGTIMGMPSKNMTVLGFDNYKKVYNHTLFSSLGTATHNTSGTLDASGKILTLKGEMEDAMAGKRPVKNVMTFETDDKVVFESFDTMPDGKEFKVLESAFMRQK